jgi:hypothetical protein
MPHARPQDSMPAAFSFPFKPDAAPWQRPAMNDVPSPLRGSRAIRWAAIAALSMAAPSDARAGTSAESNLRPHASPPALQYTNSPAPIPNYLEGKRWGTQGEAISRMQLPLPPADSAQHLVTMPGFTSTVWYGILGPAKLPREVVERVGAATRRLLAEPEVLSVFSAQGVEPNFMVGEEFAAFLRAEVPRWAKLIRDTGASSN